MISSKDPASEKLVVSIREQVGKLLQGYFGRMVSTPMLFQLRHAIIRTIISVTGQPLSESDFNKWVSIVVDKEDPSHLIIQLHHERMVDYRDDVPDWVWALSWVFNPGFAPHFKCSENQINNAIHTNPSVSDKP